VAKNGFRIFDSDIHVIEPANLFEDFLEAPYRDRIPRVRRSDVTGVDTWVIDGRSFPMWNEWPEYAAANARLAERKASTPLQVKAFEHGFDAATTLEAMDAEGVDATALFRTIGGTGVIGMDGLGDEYATALCRAYNNWLSSYCAADPARLKGVALLPLQSVDMAIEEARRAVQELGFVGVTVHCEPVDGHMLHDARMEPLWAELVRLNVPLCLHGTSTAPGELDVSRKFLHRPAGRTLTHTVAFPMQIMGAFAGLALSGTLERHPSLRVALLEANCSWLPWFLYRLDDQQRKYADSPLPLEPSAYFHRQCVASMEADEALALEALPHLGADHLVVSTDYPHPDSGFPHVMDEFFELDLSDDARRQILWDNCIRLYGLEGKI
jgi:predicted TIM-barrel fold metal-dependent hydrolase